MVQRLVLGEYFGFPVSIIIPQLFYTHSSNILWKGNEPIRVRSSATAISSSHYSRNKKWHLNEGRTQPEDAGNKDLG